MNVKKFRMPQNKVNEKQKEGLSLAPLHHY